MARRSRESVGSGSEQGSSRGLGESQVLSSFGSTETTIVYEPTTRQSLEEKAAEDIDYLAGRGFAYPADSKVLEVDAIYRQAISELTNDEPELLRKYQESLSETLESVRQKLPSLSQYKPGSPEAVEAAKEAISIVIGGLGRIREEPTDLQRLLITQGAKYFPVIDEVELWALREEGKEKYWEHVATASEKRKQFIEDMGVGKMNILNDDKPTRSYGRHQLHQRRGALFWSNSQGSLTKEDPEGVYIGEDELLAQAALYALSTNTDEEFFGRHKDTIQKIFPEFKKLDFNEIKVRMEREKKRAPNLADYISKAEIPLWHDGKMIGFVKASYRMKNLAMKEITDDLDKTGVGSMVLDEEQRRSGNDSIDEWVVGQFAAKMRNPEYQFLLEAEDGEGNKRFPIPTAGELEENPDAWNRLHALNSHQRYIHSQKLREWVVKGKRDEGLEKLLGTQKREEILQAIKREHAKDPENQHIPEGLEEVPGVVDAGLATIYERMLPKVMGQQFADDLEDVQNLYGLQREATPSDMQAVMKELKVTEPDPIARPALLDAVQAVAPYLVEALGHTPRGTIVERTGKGLEQKVKRMDLLGQTRADYEIEEVLGQGAMGIVLRARHKKMRRRPVALKLLSGKRMIEEGGQAYKERFDKEMEIGSLLDHRHVVRLYDSGDEGHLHYMALEYMGGGSLQEHLDQEGVASHEQVRQVLEQTARALEHTEEKKIIHRDIKPENIMMTETGEYKLADFGMALEVEKDDDGAGSIVGTPHFMAPEQMKGKVTQQSDLYSLGATAYRALTGRTPYEAENINELLMQVINPSTQPTPLRELNKEVPEDLVTIVEKLMAKDTDERYQNATELLRDLGGGGPTGMGLHPPRKDVA